MNIIADYLPYMNGFRNLYQSGEVIAEITRDLRNFNPVQRIFLINKIAIAVLDIFSTLSINVSRNTSQETAFYAFNLIEGGCRLAEICRGFYLYHTDPNIDHWDCLGNIMLNLVNVYRLAIVLLNPLEKQSNNLAVVACVDTALRICLLFRTELMSKVINFLRNHHVDLYARVVAQVVLSIGVSLTGLGIMLPGIQQIPNNKLHVGAVAGLGTLACMAAMVIKNAVHKVFDSFGFQQSFVRNLAEWSFTVISSGALTGVAALGLGLSKSKSSVALDIIVSIVFGSIIIGYSVYRVVDLASGNNPQNWGDLLQEGRLL